MNKYDKWMMKTLGNGDEGKGELILIGAVFLWNIADDEIASIPDSEHGPTYQILAEKLGLA